MIPPDTMPESWFSRITLTHALVGNAVVGVVTLTSLEQWLRIALLIVSLILTVVTIYHKIHSHDK